ncbi:MAG: hydantoinase B/oxoprolinase family protein [Deltaproteobacteria bacterium]|nr:hydantoinase B/oxoprolinase family protein [Deltaproteobacteria bacterium]
MGVELDPVRYEMFRHRLFQILEEGRVAMQSVSGSPVVVEGGECMSSFYDADGTVILTAAGLLLHCTGCQEAIQRAIAWYEQDPGIHDGDQFFFNDPYIAATHVYDMLVVKPIFFRGRRIAWTGAMMHTADTGGVLRGGHQEIFHEGIRIPGLKIVERGHLRPDAFRALTGQCRDPDYVGLDLKARIAANNVCARHYLRLVERYGVEFVEAAGEKIIADSERMARARLRGLPDGTWRARVYAFAHPRGERTSFRVVCTMTKCGEELFFDFTGTSPQNADSANCTLSCAWSSLFVALAGHLFWDVPWNGGMVAPVRLHIPEGTVLNCTFPAACSQGPAIGGTLYSAAHACIARMLYAGGRLEDINAAWDRVYGGEYRRLGGHNQHGGVVAQQIYDFFGGGLGAAPFRDGVHTGGHMLNPQARISDVELIEMNYPLLFLCRNQAPDSGGAGKHQGGMGMARIMMVYGTRDLTDNRWPPCGIPGGWGLFGGYPCTVWEQRMFRTEHLPERFRQGEYPTSVDELGPSWGEPFPPDTPTGRLPVPEYTLLVDRAEASGGSGYGDPLDRDPVSVAADLRDGLVSRGLAEGIYGVIVEPEAGALDPQATRARRDAIRAERLREACPLPGRTPGTIAPSPAVGGTDPRAQSDRSPAATADAAGEAQAGTPAPGRRIHESLEVVTLDGTAVIRCLRCRYPFGPAAQNYKRRALRRVRDLYGVGFRSLGSERPDPPAFFQEYLCPGCGTLLQVDVWCPALDDEEPLWDIQVEAP